ncbi:terpene cyclase/mutase family protein [Mucilaginibacter sp. SMC90]|uniref:prenyltransferase/squalene oxidase repeat-containing protein n=1 Tax=Mucilaginibacter sp. SMC90 TaxID=2929803 RepID=UPI001FB25D39|nr:prenyltransferase/squalene oxidase repeat-containing protein [Mucilaginibacter sp. SMC90]UOE50863.1 terpene cyclase/mutase family protein [Mucilaginibacter sp. SMC90]
MDILTKRKKSILRLLPELGMDELVHFVSGGDLYLNYPDLFYEPLTGRKDHFSNRKLALLCLAGVLYYRFLLKLDRKIDTNQSAFNPETDLEFITTVESSVRILSLLFKPASPFWARWGTRRGEFIEGMQIDFAFKQYMKDTNPFHVHRKEVTMELYTKLARGKCAFGKSAVDGISILYQTNHQVSGTIMQIHDNFMVAWSIIDDLEDFRKDIENPQINYCIWKLSNYYHDNLIDYQFFTTTEHVKYLFLSGVGYTCYEDAVHVLEGILTSLKDIPNAHFLSGIIQLKKREYKLKQLAILGYLDKFNATFTNHGNKKLQQYLNKQSLQYGKERAVNYISSRQNENGSWHDYELPFAGTSNVWITSYVLTQTNTALKSAGQVERAINFLKDNKSGSLWGYNKLWLSDADSTTCSLLAFHLNNESVENELSGWLTFQATDGGFKTYDSHESLVAALNLRQRTRDITAGWTGSHLCVSALAYYFLYHKGLSNTKAFKKLNDYILKNRNDRQLWDAYWWTSPVYSTSYVLQTMIRYNFKKYRDIIESSIAALLAMRNRDFSYADERGEVSCFYTALVMKVLIEYNKVVPVYGNEIKQISSWLLHQQLSDGSFPSSYCLKTPAPNVIGYVNSKDWKAANKTNANAVRDDFHRVFTTASCINAMIDL